MTARGWSADPFAVLRHRAVAWLAENVAAALGSEVDYVVAALDMLAADGICMPGDGYVRPPRQRG